MTVVRELGLTLCKDLLFTVFSSFKKQRESIILKEEKRTEKINT